MSPLPRIRLSLFPLAIAAALGAVVLGCSSREQLVLGDHMANEPGETAGPWVPGLPSGHPPFRRLQPPIEIIPLPPDHPPIGQGGGPPSNCHPDPGDLGEPSEVPDGFQVPDHSEVSPAHPPHLRTPEHRGKHWEDQI